MIKILDKYLIVNFLRPFFYSLIAFTGIMLVTNVFETIDALISSQVSLTYSCQYFLLKIPQIITLILPISILLATLFSLSKLSYQNEITAMKANGLNIYRIFTPILILAFFLSILSFFWNETMVVKANQIVNFIKQTQIKKIDVSQDEAYHISLYLSGGRFLRSSYLNKNKGLMEDIHLLDYTPQNFLKVRLDAKYAKWNGKNWISGQGVKRRFNSSGEIVSAYQFKEEILPLTKSPDDILEIIFFEKKEPEEISFFSLLRYITILRKCGSKVTNYLVEFHMKVSFPMINFMMVLIGAPLALFTTLKGRSIAEFGISIFIGFIYWGTMAIGRSLGRSEMLSPFLSAWLANLIFGFLGIYLLVKVKK